MSMTRSMLGTLLPLAIEDLADGLGIAWSCTLLAGISAALALVPFGFVAYGERIRGGSRFSAALRGKRGGGGGGEGEMEMEACGGREGNGREGNADGGGGGVVGVGLGRVATSLSAV